MPISVKLLSADTRDEGLREAGFDFFFRLPESNRLPLVAEDGNLYADWRAKKSDLTKVAAAFIAALPGQSGAPMLFDASGRVAPVLLSQDSKKSVQQGLQTLLTQLREAGADQARILACRLVGGESRQRGFWGDICNCEPDSRSSLVATVRARRGTPEVLRQLGQPLVEYQFATDSLSAEAERPLPLRTTGMRYIALEQGLQLARLGAALCAQPPLRLLWVDSLEGAKIWGVQLLPRLEADPVRRKYTLTGQGEVIGTGSAVGRGIVSGRVRQAQRPDEIQVGEILLVDRLEPFWHNSVARAAGIITRRGGRTSHAALIAAELGIPAIVGCTLSPLEEGAEVTLDCEQASKGRVLAGKVAFDTKEIFLDNPPDLPLDLLLDIANPYRAFSVTQVPHRGIGLVRQEFIVGHMVGVHPRALLSPERLDRKSRQQLEEKSADYDSHEALYVDRLCHGVSALVTAAQGQPVTLRLSDFKSDEYTRLLGGEVFEMAEPNPMLGLRGASRYLQHDFRACLELECRAVLRLRNELALRQVEVLIPFVRTPEEGASVLEILADCGLKRGENGLKIHMMCEIPANLVMAEELSELFDGFSVGTSDLTQLMLGVDRGSPMVAHLFDEGHTSLLRALEKPLQIWLANGCRVHVCGRGISINFPLALWFARQQVHGITVSPQRAADMWLMLHEQLSGTDKP